MKVNDKLASEDVSPSDTSAAVMVIVGGVVSGSFIVTVDITGGASNLKLSITYPQDSS